MRMRALALLAALALPCAAFAAEPSIKIEPPQLGGSRALEKSTGTEALRDYLHAWDTLQTALGENQANVLEPDFVGTARDKLAETIAAQVKLGMHTEYQVLSHDLRFTLYSPEGQSLQLTDTVEYSEQVFAGDKALAKQTVTSRYLVVMTPAEVRWRVRVFQAEPAR